MKQNNSHDLLCLRILNMLSVLGTTTSRRPSLERQTTLYDDQYYNTDNSGYYPSIEITDSR